MPTKIPWTNEVVNPIRTEGGGYHCTKISTGCTNCYAEGINRQHGDGHPYDNRQVDFVLRRGALDKVDHWRNSRRIFFQSMSDLFHEDVSLNDLYNVFANVEHHWSRHTCIFLTKRPFRAVRVLSEIYGLNEGGSGATKKLPKNIWMGISASNQENFDKRWRVISQLPASVLFVSGEPLLGPIDFSLHSRLPDWFIVGPESGKRARPMPTSAARMIRDQCVENYIPFTFKYKNEFIPLDEVVWDGIPQTESPSDQPFLPFLEGGNP